MDLNTIWFILFGVLISGYAVLDGFDLGVGTLHLFAKTDEERDIHVASIGPVWDGNEVWLLTGGGALFAAFPIVYGAVFSGFYLALMLVLLALILRAVSLEFRHANDAPKWVKAWDYVFGISSLLPSILFGVAVGNVMRGVPLDAAHAWHGSFLGLLNPFSIVMGVFSLVMFLLQGAIYLHLKSEGALQERMAGLINKLWVAFVALYAVVTGYAYVEAPHLFAHAGSRPVVWLMLVLAVGSMVAIKVLHGKGNAFGTMIASSAAIVSLIFLTAANMFPRLVPSSMGLEHSLTIYNASSSKLTLTVMLVIALIGMPIVIGYTVWVYRLFKGKVNLADSHY